MYMSVNATRILPLVFAAATVLLAGCQAPAVVDGVVRGDAFSIRDDNPEVRPQHEGTLIVLADDALGKLRLVKLFVADLEGMPTDEPLDIAPSTDVRLEAAIGDMESFVRSDGVTVVSSTNATFVEAVRGTFTLASRDPLAGDFAVTLRDGGELVGSFVISD